MRREVAREGTGRSQGRVQGGHKGGRREVAREGAGMVQGRL